MLLPHNHDLLMPDVEINPLPREITISHRYHQFLSAAYLKLSGENPLVAYARFCAQNSIQPKKSKFFRHISL